MTKTLISVFRETLSFFRADPLGMVHVVVLRIFGGMPAAQKRLDEIAKKRAQQR